MKKIILILTSFCAFTAQSQNEYITALDKIQANYNFLSQKIDSMTAHLDANEKQIAANFLVATYDLVMESYVYKGNPANPGLTDWMKPPYRKFAGDNPHTIYTQAFIDAKYTYKLTGKLGSAFYLGIQNYSSSHGYNLTSGNISLDQMKINKKTKTFEVILSKERPVDAKNWVPIAEGDHSFIIRQYFKDRNNVVPADFKIERIDKLPTPADNYLERLEKANLMLTEYIMGTIEVCNLLKTNALNAYPDKNAQVRAPKYGGALYPTKDNRYEGFWVQLKKGEAIHLHGTLPKDAKYVSFVFYDRWYQTPDYYTINSFMTGDELTINPDGTYDIYISPEKINHPNWIDTGGLYEGSYSSRYLLSNDTNFPTVEIVNVAQIIPVK